ncbi:MAG: YitT family protein [Bacteroidales bacterium]|nr:YitT family protein [Bacteroidales bacterium]
MTISKKSFFSFVKEYALITLGILLYVTGWNLFLVPNNLVGGGVSGIAAIVQYATQGAIKIGTTYFFVNAILLIIALFVLGKGFGGKTVYAVIIASVGLNVLQGFIPAEITQTLAVDNGKLMSTIMGGILVGVGIGMTMSQGGSTGGTDIIALIVNKYRNVSPGRMILWMDVVIILSSMIVPSYSADGQLLPWTEKVTTVVYGFILVVVNSTVLDLYLSGSRQSVQLFILSQKYAEIADMITNELHRGVTVLDGKGWYTKHNTEVLMVLTRKSDLSLLLRMVKSVDSNAFLSVSSVTGVYGKGFDQIKEKVKVTKDNISKES